MWSDDDDDRIIIHLIDRAGDFTCQPNLLPYLCNLPKVLQLYARAEENQ